MEVLAGSHRARFLGLLCKKTLGEKEWDKSRLWTDIWFTMQRDT